MSEPRILVIGEKFIDRYFVGTATRLSPEAPIPVVAVSEVIQFAGGAANVARNLEALGADTILYTPQDTPVKNRLVANGHQLARWDENDHIRPTRIPEVGQVDGIVISDYNKGSFTTETISNLKDSIPFGTWLFIDTKTDPAQYFCLGTNSIFFPNSKEWTTYEASYDNYPQVVRTESEKGMTYLSKYCNQDGKYKTAHQPALAKEVVSVCGAGDTAIAAFAYQFCKTKDIDNSLCFASKACAVVVSKPYTATASHEEINKIKP